MDSKSLRFITHQSFFSAVRSDDLESLKNIIQNEGSDPSSLMALQNDEKETAIYIAAENNFLESFIYLLSFCDLQTVKIRAKSDMDAFHVAAARGHLGIFIVPFTSHQWIIGYFVFLRLVFYVITVSAISFVLVCFICICVWIFASRFNFNFVVDMIYWCYHFWW